ncbi:MAG: phosphoglycerate dehydrogenase [Chloroflexota bacterium]
MARVLVTTMQVDSLQDALLQPLHDAGHELVLKQFPKGASEPDLIEALRGAHAGIVGVEPYTASVLAHATDLKILARTGVGYDAIDLDAANGMRVLVTTTIGANHHSVAEAAIGMILAATRRFAFADRQMRSTGWNPRPYGVELRHKTVGVIGTGLIGKEVIRRLQGWDVTLLLHDVVQDKGLEDRYGARYVDLETLLRESDAVTVHAPLLRQTHHMINKDTLALMKPTAFLVNTSRGPLVDEEALADALEAGSIAGASLDVFEVEPLPTTSRLLKIPNITLTQHVAGVTFESMRAMTAMAVDNVAKVLRGERPASCVNPELLDQA